MHARAVLALVSVGIAVATSADAFPTYGTFVDTTCTANGWVPPKPFNPNGGNASDPRQANCGLCHTNAQSPSASFTAAGARFRASGFTDVTPFCAAPTTNHPPQFRPVAAQTAMVGALYQLTVTATDPDAGDMLLLTVANAPTGSTFTDNGNGTGTFRWTPGAADVGSHPITFHAADTGTPMGVATLDVAIGVGQAVNHPPVLAPLGNQSADVGVELALSLSATDSDGDSLTYAALGLPAGASLVGNQFRFTPDASQVGNHSLTFTVTDDGTPPAMDSESITITVGNTNRPPVLAPIGNRSAVVGARVQIALSATDPDRDALRLACAGLPGDALLTDLGDGTGVIDWSPSAAGSSRVSCTATDDGVPQLADAEIFTLTATSAAPAPGSAGPIVDDARWVARDGRLVVRGHWEGGSGGQPVGIYGVARDGSAFLLGTRFPRGSRFGLEVQPFVVPCEVAAGVDGTAGAATGVTGAPADCGEMLLTRARADLECDGDVLHVEGRRGPLGGAIVLLDATTGAELARIPVGQRGEFSFEGIVASAPRQLQLRAELGALVWQLPDAVPVRRGECGEREDDASGAGTRIRRQDD
jgi:hypothetical protein